MISVYGLSETAFDHNGEAVLCPTKAAVKMVAGGEYSFTMEHPMDPWGKWKRLKREAVVRLPVPKETIDAASVGYDTDVYEITTKADLREEPQEPTVIYYTPWVAGTSYAVGAKVSYSNKNYRCEYMDPSSGFLWMTPDTSSWWKQIPRMTAGAAVLSTLKAGTEVYLLEESGDWYKVMTKYGLTGYVKKTQATYKRHITPADLAPREITEQLFRIKEVSVDRKSGVVSVSGNHVSNDLNGTLVERVTLTDAPPAMAIGMIAEGLMGDYRGDIATNLYGDGVTITYTADIKRKNGMFCLTDPDTGVVPKMNAKFTRDNWDLFIMKRSAVLADLRIAYGKNTDGIIWKQKSDSLVTRVVPVAKDEKGEDLYLDADGESAKWVDSTHIGDYPVIYMEALNVKGQVGKETEEGSGTNWTLTTLLEEMRTKAQERFTVDGADIPETEVTVQLEQLSGTAEYARLRGLDGAVLYDIVTVHDPDIGLSLNLAVSEIEYDCVAGRITGIKLVTNLYGKDRSVTGFNVVNKSITGAKLADEVTEGIMNEVRGIIPEYADPNASRPVSVTDNDVTLAYGERSTIGDIQGTALHVTMPAAEGFDPNSLSEDTADINDNTLFLQVGSTSYKKKFGKVWEYIKGKISSVLGLSESGYTGNAATATNADKLDGKHAADFILASTKGANGGVAELDSGGKVPQSQLPSYVDDVLEYASLSNFPATGETGKIYVALDTNKTYRWGGSSYVEISPSLALGETSSTAYRGDRGKTAYDHAAAKGSAFAAGLYKVTTNSEGHITAATAVQKSDITALGIPGSDTTYSAGTGLSLVGTTFSVKTGYTGSGKNYPVLADGSGNLYVAVPWENNTYSAGTGLSLSNGTFAVKLGYTSSGKNYKVEADSSGNLYVNVPWTDHYAWSDITDKPATATRWPTWDEVTGKPSTFAPSAHTHSSKDLTNIAFDWAGSYSNGSWMLIYNGETGTNGGALFRAISRADTASWVDNEHKWVRLAGDTMTGNLIIQKAGEAYAQAYNSATGIRLYLDSDTDGTHGIYSNGYYNGSAFVSSGKWILTRGTDGKITFYGDCTGNAATATDADKLDGHHGNEYGYFQSKRDFTNGTLIVTDIDYPRPDGDAFYLEIKGNSYGSLQPFMLAYQGYCYNNTVINHGGYSYGKEISGIVMTSYTGNNVTNKLAFWFPRQAYWQGFSVWCAKVTGKQFSMFNCVIDVYDEAKPTSNYEVAAGIIELAKNDGRTYGISITGDANAALRLQYNATVTNDSEIDAFLEANKIKAAIWKDTSSPGTANGILISGSYSSTNYGFQIAIDDDPSWLMALRQRNGNGWGAWKRIPMGDGTGASGTWPISITGNAATATELPTPTEAEDSCLGNDATFKVFKSTTTAPGADGFILGMKWSSGNYAAQLYIDTDPTYSMALRNRDSQGVWNDWKRIPMGDGTGASGTWGISVTGSAGSVAWGNVTGKPNRAASNSDGGDAINSDKVDNYHASDLAKTKYLGWGTTLQIPSTHAKIMFNQSHEVQVWLAGSGTATNPYGISVGMTYFKDTGISGYRKTLWDNSNLTLNLGDEYNSSSTRFRIIRASDNKSFTFTSDIDGFVTYGTITAFYH